MVENAFFEDCGERRGGGGAFGGLSSSHSLPVRGAPKKKETRCGMLSEVVIYASLHGIVVEL